MLTMMTKFKFHYDSINSLFHFYNKLARQHLNSIMILLIHGMKKRQEKIDLNLNSIMILLIRMKIYSSRADKNDLNSIMILLIRHLQDSAVASVLDLNSIMILLIRIESLRKSKGLSQFKFHYDSINSRPKIIPLFKPKNVSILSTSSKFNISFLSLIIYFCNTSYFRRFRLLSIPYIFCTIMGRQKPLIFQVNFVRHILL